MESNPLETEDEGTLFRDVLFGLLGVVLMVLFVLFVLPKNPKNNESETDRSRGNIRVEVLWDNDLDVDIDTWVKSPNNPPVGYSNKNGEIFNLVRDDLGKTSDITGINYEIVYSRGILAGEYIVAVHWYRNPIGEKQIPVKVLVSLQKDDTNTGKGSPINIIRTQVILKRVGQEITVIRFRIDSNGDLVRTSMNNIPKPIKPERTNPWSR